MREVDKVDLVKKPVTGMKDILPEESIAQDVPPAEKKEEDSKNA